MDGGQQSVFSADFFSIHYGFFSQAMVQIRHPLSHLCKPSHRLEGFHSWFHAPSLDVPMASHRCTDGALRVFVHIAG
jgi:hypothetical protein